MHITFNPSFDKSSLDKLKQWEIFELLIKMENYQKLMEGIDFVQL